jgi:hypothetical protein
MAAAAAGESGESKWRRNHHGMAAGARLRIVKRLYYCAIDNNPAAECGALRVVLRAQSGERAMKEMKRIEGENRSEESWREENNGGNNQRRSMA